jgi:hypothetical protein
VPLRFTSLRVTAEHQVLLFDGHVRRLGEDARAALRAFEAAAEPGAYRATWDGTQLLTTPRPPSRLVDGIPTRFAVSPFADQRGRFPKPAPPSRYDGVRLPGVATLLTDGSGDELFEGCVASLVAWDGVTLVLPPEDAPAVASVAEAALAARLPHRRARLLVSAGWPLLLINAVAGTCAPSVEGRAPFPEAVRARVDALLR